MSPHKPPLPHGLLLGFEEPPRRSNGFPVPVWDHSREGHLVTVAPTGAGKGTGCIIPALLTWRGPAIVIDPKGENYLVTAAHRRRMGQKVHVLDPFGITDCLQPAALNPFDALTSHANPSTDELKVLAWALIQQKALGDHQDPFWDNRAASLIVEAMRYCLRHLPNTTLADVRTVVESYDFESGLRPDISVGVSCHPNIRAIFQPDGMAMHRTRVSITSTAVEHLAFITDGPVQNSLWRSTIDLKKVERGDPITIYLVLPPDKLHTHAKLLRLWLSMLMGALFKRRLIPKVPTLMLVDEAAQLGELKPLTAALTLMRGFGMKVWTFWQDLAQLRQVYPTEWQTILNNSTVHQYFGSATPMAGRLLQDYLGDTCPRPVGSFRSNELALYRPGHRGAVMRIPNYLADAMFQGLYDPNPYHTHPPELVLVDDDYAYDVEEKDGAVILNFPAKESRDA